MAVLRHQRQAVAQVTHQRFSNALARRQDQLLRYGQHQLAALDGLVTKKLLQCLHAAALPVKVAQHRQNHAV